MFRALTILAAVVALAVPATAPAYGGKMHLDDISMGVITDDTKTTTLVWWSR